MKIHSSLILGCLLLTSCGIIGEKSAQVTLTSKGLTTEKHYLMVDNIESNKNEFAIGTDLNYILQGVTGFSLKDNRALFGSSMTVTDQATQEVVLHYDDLFSDSPDGYSKEDASQLNLKLSIGSPMLVDHSYDWNFRVWDKRGKSEMTVDLIFKVVKGEDLVGIKTDSQGLKPSEVFILSNGSLSSTDVKIGQRLTMIFNDIDGYAIQADSTVSIGATMVVNDKDGNPQLEYSDLFQNYKSLRLDQATSTSVYLTVGDPMKSDQTYLWKVRVWDKNNQRYFESSVSIRVDE